MCAPLGTAAVLPLCEAMFAPIVALGDVAGCKVWQVQLNFEFRILQNGVTEVGVQCPCKACSKATMLLCTPIDSNCSLGDKGAAEVVVGVMPLPRLRVMES